MSHINLGVVGDHPLELAQTLAKQTDAFDITYFDTIYQGEVY